MEARKRREAAEEVLIAARLQLQQGDDAQLDAATLLALEASAEGALPKRLRVAVWDLLALAHQRHALAEAKQKRKATGAVVHPPDPEEVAAVLDAELPWEEAHPSVLSSRHA